MQQRIPLTERIQNMKKPLTNTPCDLPVFRLFCDDYAAGLEYLAAGSWSGIYETIRAAQKDKTICILSRFVSLLWETQQTDALYLLLVAPFAERGIRAPESDKEEEEDECTCLPF